MSMHPTREGLWGGRWARPIASATALLAALSLGTPALAEEEPSIKQHLLTTTTSVTTLEGARSPSAGIGNRGPGCPATTVTRANNFDWGANDEPPTGQNATLQQGFVNNETAAVEFAMSPADYPVRLDMIQAVLGTVATVPTETQFEMIVWDGPPNVGPIVDRIRSVAQPEDETELGHLMLPAAPGGNQAAIGVIIYRYSPDLAPDERVVLNDPTGSGTFSVGVRILRHHNTANENPCNPSRTLNAFPATEGGTCCTQNLLNFAQYNWLESVSCPLACDPGWHRFSQLEQAQCSGGECLGCRPAADWLIRARWTSLSCGPQTEGACCLLNGACEVVFEADCAGAWTASGVCVPNSCPQPTGACCTDGNCTVVERDECVAGGGAYQGDAVACEGLVCPEPSGACCIGTGCQVRVRSVCQGFGGTFVGAGIACGPSGTCPRGACCLPSGSCTANQTEPQCLAQGGTFQGVGVACENVGCPQPQGACCAAGGTGFCSLETEADCVSFLGGTWQGAGRACQPGNPCASTGACCFPGGTCTDTVQSACTGSWRGVGTTCGPDPNNSRLCCPANFDEANGLQVADIFAFLRAWFANSPSADFDQQNGIQVADIFSFLRAWFAGC